MAKEKLQQLLDKKSKTKKWKKLAVKRLFTGRMILEEWRMRTHQGKRHSFTMHTGKDIVVVVGRTSDKKIIVLKQYYISLGAKVWALVAGLVDKGEKPLFAARREFTEESGYKAQRLIFLGTAAKGKYSTGLYYFYLAWNARQVKKQTLEDAEDIDVIEIELSFFRKLLYKGHFRELSAEVAGQRVLHYLATH